MMVYIIVEKCQWSSVKWFITIKGTHQSRKVTRTKQQMIDILCVTDTEMTKLQAGGPIERQVTDKTYKELIND